MPRLNKPTPEELERYRTGQVDSKGRPICGAKKRDGKPCSQLRIMPNGRCRQHGGATPSGPASPHYKDGRYSRVLPTRMAADYQAAQADPDLLSVRNDIALIDARLADVLARVDTGEAGALWTAARDAYKVFTENAADLVKAKAALSELGDILLRGQGDWAAWREIGDLLEQRRRAVESESKRERELDQAIPVARVLLLFGALGGIIATHVKDTDARNSIQAEFSRLIDGGIQQASITGRAA